MHGSQPIILASAATIAVVHTVIGIDHYLPFIVLSRAGGWSLRKTLAWTFVCGLGHVLSSVALGLLGVGLGWALSSLQRFESVRGEIAGIALIGFGVVYLAWGLWRGRRGHTHVHVHADGSLHSHPHDHPGVEPAPHESPEHVSAHNRTLWVLFTIFVLGPCEPLIPLLIAPASRHDAAGVASVAALDCGPSSTFSTRQTSSASTWMPTSRQRTSPLGMIWIRPLE